MCSWSCTVGIMCGTRSITILSCTVRDTCAKYHSSMEFGQIQIIWTNSDCSLTAGRTSVRPVANHRFTPPSEATGAGPVGTQTAVGTQHAICPNYCICPNLMLKWYHFSTKVGQRGKVGQRAIARQRLIGRWWDLRQTIGSSPV